MITMNEVLANIGKDGRRHIVSVSGGKDSAALAIYLKDKYPQIALEYVFCDTGVELQETYDYLNRLEALIGKKIIHVNALSMLDIAEKEGRNAFDYILEEMYGGFLPSPRMRWCTRILKIAPFEKYVGSEPVYSYIGIRSDEDREGYSSKKPPVISHQANIIPVYPFKDDNLGIQDIKNVLVNSGLGLPKYYEWRSRSGCFFCFYQQIGEWQGLKEKHPVLYERAKAYERVREDGRQFTWCSGGTLDEITSKPRRTIQTADETDGCAICHL